MTRGDLDSLTFLGRPVKPLALAIALSVATIFWFNIVDNTDVLADAGPGDIVGAMAGASVVLLFAGWLTTSQAILELGLVISAGVWIARAMTVLLISGPGDHAFWYSMSWTFAASSAFPTGVGVVVDGEVVVTPDEDPSV